MGFADSIKAFGKKALIQANSSVSTSIEGLFVDEVILSPTSPEAQYATGLLINSYYPMVGGGYDLTVGTVTDYYGASSLSRIRSTLAGNHFLGRDNVITLTNSVPEAYRANSLGWPMGEGTNGWQWTGKVQAYRMRETAIINWRGKYL